MRESEFTSSGGIVPSVNAVGQTQEKLEQDGALKWKKSSRRKTSTDRIRRRDLRNPADHWILEKLHEV
jgi:hypothetical protein